LNAHRLVIVAAALTIVVAAALATALATFSGQGLPRAVHRDLTGAGGTSLVITGSTDASQAGQYTSSLPGQVSSALDGTPFAFYHGAWSDPLGFAAGSRPARPASAGNQPIVEAAALGDVTAQATLVSGHWPSGGASGGASGGTPIPAALPATAAALLHVSVGDVLRLQDRISSKYIEFVVTGLYRPSQLSSPYWGLDDINLTGSSTASGYTTYGPLTVQAAAFAGPLTVYSGSWLAQPQTARVPASQLNTVAANVTQLKQSLQDAQNLPALTLSTSLPSVLTGTASNLDVARSLLAICAVLLLLLAAAALLAVARLLAGQREGESAMLTARGATRWQLVRLACAEAAPLCVVAAAVGGVIGVLLARLLAGTGPAGAGLASTGSASTGSASTGSAGIGPIGAGAIGDAAAACAAVAIGAVLIMVLPALTRVTPGTARARRGRQAAVSGVTRAGGDLALVLLAVVAGWQLRNYSATSAGANGNFGIDPVIVVAPALALLGGTVLALRLLPAGGKAGDRLAARGRRLNAALASWQISRRPLTQGGAALLIVLATATGTLALAQHQSWMRSDHDQAAFTAGADVRVQTPQPLSVSQANALVQVPGVQDAMPAATFTQPSDNAETLAIDSTQATRVSLIRADQSPLPVATLFGKIKPAGPATGVTLPGHPAQLGLTVRLGPASLGLAAVTVSAAVQDTDGNVYELDLGSLPADGRDHTLTAPLGDGRAGPVYPLRLISVSLDYTMPGTRPRTSAALTVVSVSGGPAAAPVGGAALGGWAAEASSPELQGVRATTGAAGPSGLPAVSSSTVSSAGAAGGALSVTFTPGYGLSPSGYPGVPPSAVDGQLQLTPASRATTLPGLATQRFLAASNASVGSTVTADVNGANVSVKIVAALATFPTVTASGGGLIVDLSSLQTILNRAGLEPAQATQWWLATRSGLPPGLAASLPPGSAITSMDGVSSGLLGNPLSTVPQQALLAIAIAAAVLAITGYCVSIAASVRQRRAENALLAALGVAPRAAAGQLCLEKLMLSVPSALAGLVLGVIAAELLVPALTLTTAATTPIPPVLILFGWSQALPLALAVAVLPVLAAALTIARRPDAAAALRSAEAA
jgi:ABC-type antimicrobial peptide transport system permease subunit